MLYDIDFGTDGTNHPGFFERSFATVSCTAILGLRDRTTSHR